MEITKKNLIENLPKIKSDITKADFVSLDLQLTGSGHYDNSTSSFSTPEQRYKAFTQEVRDYGILQVGLSLFGLENGTNYVNSSYTFQLSGNPRCSHTFETSFWCHLLEKGWNFNKFFKEGLPYMSMKEAIAAEERLTNQQCERDVTPLKIKSTDATQFFSNSVTKIKEAQETGERFVFKTKHLSPFFIKLIKINIAQEFPCAVFQNCDGLERNIEVIHFESQEEKKLFLTEQKEMELKNKIGFGLVVREIMESQIPIVGHNAWLQMMHFIDKFVQPLPDTLEKFTDALSEILPPVYDTELMAREASLSKFFKSKEITHIFSRMMSRPFRHPSISAMENGEVFSTTELEYHINCGYQAFMVGCCFLTMLKKQGGTKWLQTNPLNWIAFKDFKSSAEILKSYESDLVSYRYRNVPDMNSVYRSSSTDTESSSKIEITRYNFDQRFDEICQNIDEADFISFDFEFTGLGQSGENKLNDLDTPEERYQKRRAAARKYGITQMGLSLFKGNGKNKFINSTYCFNLTGSSEEPIRYDVNSMTFMADHGFNYNKFLQEGLPFLSLMEEGLLKKSDNDKSVEAGFGKIAQKILTSKTPLIGHNMWLDILHFVDKFFMRLPESFAAFQKIAQQYLPPMYDTKLISKHDEFTSMIENTSLTGVCERILTEPFHLPALVSDIGTGTYTLKNLEDFSHDAGYDAFMTGICFITMLNYLDRQRKGPPLESAYLVPILNKVNFMWSWDMSSIHLHDQNDVPDRSYIYVVHCPPTWTMNDVKEIFLDKLKSYKTVWVSSTKLYVIPTDVGVGDKAVEAAIISRAPRKVKIFMHKPKVSYAQRPKIPTPNQPKRSIGEDEVAQSETVKPKKKKKTASESTPAAPLEENDLFKVPEW